MRIMIVEDDPRAARGLEMRLNAEGLSSEVAYTGEDAIALAKEYDFDLILLDLNLTDISGFSVMRELRESRIRTPILALSGDAGVERMIRCFSLGADDFLPKPYKSVELVARIRAIVRRVNGHADPVVRCGDLALDINAHEFMALGNRLNVTNRESQLLELMLIRQGTTICKDVFISQIYGGLEFRDPKIIDVYICKLRKKLAASGIDPNCIETIWGRGYKLVAPKKGGTIPLGSAA